MTVPLNNSDAGEATRPSRLRQRLLALALSVAGVLVVGFTTWLVLRPSPPLPAATPAPSHASVPPPATLRAPGLAPAPAPRATQAVPQAAPDIPTADEATILAARPVTMDVFRDPMAPHVLVLSFASLHEQARMLDRLGAFVEKAGLPHDRVLDEQDLQAAIRLAGDTEDTYYYGHDYRAADIARFFALADRDGIVLHPEEQMLRQLLTRDGMLVPGADGAIISIPPSSQWPLIDEAARATILHHELSHGAYFTDPAYAAYAQNFWRNVLTEAQRDGFRRFLGSEGYDTTNEDLMLNEAQAYLVHTPDPRYFRPELAGLSDAEAARLRQIFLAGMPDQWLRTPAQIGSR